jgi:hypothetical protein
MKADKKRDGESIQLSLRRLPWRIHKALRIYAAMNSIKGVEAAIYKVLEQDVGLQQIIVQFRIQARAEEIRRIARETIAAQTKEEK